MAHCTYPDEVSSKLATSVLGRGSWEAKIDCFKMAERGDTQSRVLWNEFLADQPEFARLVIADVRTERDATRAADLEVASVTKGAKGKGKGRKRGRVVTHKMEIPPELSEALKVQGSGHVAGNVESSSVVKSWTPPAAPPPGPSLQDELQRTWRYDPDPVAREHAYTALKRLIFDD